MSKKDKVELAGRIAMASAQVLSDAYSLEPIKLNTSGSNPSLNPSIIKSKHGYLVIARSSRLVCFNDVDYIENIAKVDDINYLYELDADFNVVSNMPLDESLLREQAHCIRHCMSDARLFYWHDQLWAIGAAVRVNAESEVVSQILFRIEGSAVVDAIPLDSPINFPLEKNWTPIVQGSILKLVYSFSPVNLIKIEDRKAVIEGAIRKVTNHDVRGGTQLIDYEGGYLGLIHQPPNMWNGKRSYTHSFAWFNKDLELLEVSEPFYFQRRGLEFAAGLCKTDDGIVVSYGAGDRACMILKIPDRVIRRYLII